MVDQPADQPDDQGDKTLTLEQIRAICVADPVYEVVLLMLSANGHAPARQMLLRHTNNVIAVDMPDQAETFRANAISKPVSQMFAGQTDVKIRDLALILGYASKYLASQGLFMVIKTEGDDDATS